MDKIYLITTIFIGDPVYQSGFLVHRGRSVGWYEDLEKAKQWKPMLAIYMRQAITIIVSLRRCYQVCTLVRLKSGGTDGKASVVRVVTNLQPNPKAWKT